MQTNATALVVLRQITVFGWKKYIVGAEIVIIADSATWFGKTWFTTTIRNGVG